MLPLLGVEGLQLRGVLVLAPVGFVRPDVELVLGLSRAVTSMSAASFTLEVSLWLLLFRVKGETGEKLEGRSESGEPYPLHV